MLLGAACCCTSGCTMSLGPYPRAAGAPAGSIVNRSVAPHVLHRMGVLALTALLPACATRPPDPPANLVVGMAALPSPRIEPNGAPPRILAMRFSSLDVRRGQAWSGAMVTGTNVA